MSATAPALARWAIGLAWGMVVARPLVLARVGVETRTRARRLTLEPRRPPRPPGIRMSNRLGPVSRVAADIARRRQRRRTADAVVAGLPLAVELVGVGVTAGLTPYLAVAAAVPAAPDPVAEILARATSAVGAGMRFCDAVDAAATAAPELRAFGDALLASERLGAPVGVALARLASELRTDARRAAEIRARRVPVRLLFPLVFLVLPAFGLLTVAPAILSGFRP